MTRKETLEYAKNLWHKITHVHSKHQKTEVTRGWIRRDMAGELHFGALLTEDMFPSIRWEDKEPTHVKVTITLTEDDVHTGKEH